MAQGKFYWGLKVPEHISPSKEIFLHSDVVNIIGGTIFFMNLVDKGAMQIVMSLSEGNWHVVYAASVIDGAPLACEHWKGTVNEP